MALKFTFLFLIVFVSFYQVYCKEPCLLHLLDYSKSPTFRPFIYKLDGTLYQTKNNQVKIPHGEDVYMTCEHNFFKLYPGLHNLTVKCEDDTLVVDHDKSKKQFKNLSCDIRVMEEFKHSVEGCKEANGGIYHQYYNSKKAIVSVVAETCYDYALEQLKFVRFQLPKQVLEHSDTTQTHTDITHKLAGLTVYRQDKLDNTVKTLLTEDFKMAQESLYATKLLPRMFFNEQLQDVERFSTNFVGMWKSVSQGNWQSVLEDIKDYAEDRKNQIDIYLGTEGTLSLTRPDGTEAKMFLKENTYPVPLYVWAYVHHKKENQMFGIVTINNPFIRYDEIKKYVFCQNKCPEIGWLKRLRKSFNYDRPIHGYTFCCKDNFATFSASLAAKRN